jgi:hypothetical protein
MGETTTGREAAPTTTAPRTDDARFDAGNRRMSEAAASASADPAYRAEMQRRMRAGWALRRKRLTERATR